MFEINDNVIHKSAGACVVHDIVTEDFGAGLQQYYYLITLPEEILLRSRTSTP